MTLFLSVSIHFSIRVGYSLCRIMLLGGGEVFRCLLAGGYLKV